MIIVKIKGGLGNQMFQYAIGKSFSYYNQCELKLDLREFKKYKLHKYNLDCFNIDADFASSDDFKKVNMTLLNNSLFSKIYFKLKRNKSNHQYQAEVKGMEGSFCPEIFNLKGDVYLDGYWQNEGYFKNIEQIIRSDFSFKEKPSQLNGEYLEKIRESNSVSVHIRRGDYINNPKTLKVHGFLGLNYYMQAIEIIKDNIKNPEFFIFSDDIGWAKNNLKINYPIHFIDHNNKESGHEDLRLMINCKHNIIANSTFSWWGAWLNNNPNKIVIAPSQWMSRDEMEKRKNFDIIPKEWIKL